MTPNRQILITSMPEDRLGEEHFELVVVSAAAVSPFLENE